ncbi:hypothetical protein CEQ90_20520 [Lewinellaceae bacterium SD302]|nr:hypothetical protein CEQ90_20520 [Lewinellaceae bacterium SD302]
MARVPITCAVSDNGSANAAADLQSARIEEPDLSHLHVTLETKRQPAVDGGALFCEATDVTVNY